MNLLKSLLFLMSVAVSYLPGAGIKKTEISGKRTDCYVYVSVSREKKISVFRLDTENGKLIFNDSVQLSGEPGSLCPDPSGNYLFAALRSTKSIAGLNRNLESGLLSHIKDTPVTENPVYISSAGMGKYLLLTSYSGNKTAVFPVEHGIVNPDSKYFSEARENPHMINTDPSGKYVFVPNLGGNVIQQFILQDDGTLVPNKPAEIKVNNKQGPRHFSFHPSLSVFYLLNEISSTLMTFKFDPVNGTLSGPYQELTTLPLNYSLESAAADIHLTPNGRFLYASNRGHNSIALFKVSRKEGILSPCGTFPTEKTPRSFAIDPSGRFLVSAGEGSGNIAVYKIKKNGKLLLTDVCEAGHWPVWVLIVRSK